MSLLPQRYRRLVQSMERPVGVDQPVQSDRFRTIGDVAIGAVIGLVMACVLFERSFFWGDDALVTGIIGDAGSSFAGFRAFIADDWHFPLLETDNMTNGDGDPTVIAFTDSLPLWSLIAKLFGFLGISANTWIAFWYYGAVVLQGAAAGLAASTHRVQSRWTTVTVAVVAVSAPVLIMRVWHPGLYGHFVLLLFWAAAGHFWHRRNLTAAWWMLAVTLLSLLIHPYIFAMVGAGSVGVLLSAANNRWLSLKEAGVWFAVSPLVLLTAMFVFGYLPNDAVPPGGYGAFAMPVVSPFWPQWSGLWPGNEWILANENDSFEGINYLGAGGVFAVVLALAVSRRRLLAFAIQQQLLLAVFAVMTVVAITYNVYFWTQVPVRPLGVDLAALKNRDPVPLVILGLLLLLSVALFVWSWRSERGAVVRPALTAFAVVGVASVAVTALDRDFIWLQLQQFRASGRFFWIIGYGMTLGALVSIDRWFAENRDQRWSSPALLGVTMVVLAGLQVADTGKYRDFVPVMFSATPERVEEIDALSTLALAHDEVRITPEWFCVATVNDALHEFQDMVSASTSSGVLIDGYYGGRTSVVAACAEDAVAPGDGVLTVVVRPILEPELIDKDPSVECRYSQHMALCSSRWGAIDPSIADRFAEAPLEWPSP